MASTETVCPYCHSTKVRRYSYGRTYQTMGEEEYRKQYITAGCEITPDSPVYHCDACGKDFGRMGG